MQEKRIRTILVFNETTPYYVSILPSDKLHFYLSSSNFNPERSDPVYIRDPSVVIALPADVLAPTVLGHQQA